jgi:RNA polymerase sigma-70 factor (ECF subfamily)
MTTVGSSERELILQLKLGDSGAYLQLYDKYHSSLYSFIIRFVKIPQLAEDVLQEVFLKIWEIRERINPELSFNAYIYKISRNEVFKLLKKISKDEELRTDIAYKLINSVDSADLKFQWQQYEIALNKAIYSLSPQRQKVFILCRQENKSYEEVAAELNISKNTVKEHMVLAVKSIKEYMWNHAEMQFVLAFIIFKHTNSTLVDTIL